MDRPTIDQQVQRYLRTGEHDNYYLAWPGSDFLTRARKGKGALQDALVAEVREREKGRRLPELPPGLDPASFARAKVTPMVTGLFPAKERGAVLDLLANSLVFVTHQSIAELLRTEEYLRSAWDLANLYLGSIGAKCLNGEPPYLVGMSQGTTCYVSTAYFDKDDPFADFVVHEAAHIFHNWKRKRVGLPHTRYREWLLDIDFSRREQFAYACEAYSRILEQAKSPADRRRLHAEYAEHWLPTAEERIDREALIVTLAEAVGARNGWKRILKQCAPPRRIPSSQRIKEFVRNQYVVAEHPLVESDADREQDHS